MSELDLALAEIAAFERDLVVQAGAGTGKTHALVTLYLHLVTGLGTRAEALAPSRILVITFTDKAATELRERIRDRVGALCEQGLAADPVLKASATKLGRKLPPEDVLRRALGELARAPIGTFHAFGHALLRRHAIAAGLAPDFALLEEGEARARALDAARGAVLDSLERDPVVAQLVETYSFEQNVHGGIVPAIARLRERRAEEGRAAAGMAAAYAPDRVSAERALALSALRPALAAFVFLGNAVGPTSKPRLAVITGAAQAAELEDGRAPAYLAGIRRELALIKPGKGGKEMLADAKERLTGAIEAMGEAERACAAAPMAAAIETLVDAAERRYAAWKREAGAVDFTDLLVLPRDLLRDRQDLVEAEGTRFGALLVDEFQDTSRVQAELVERLHAAGQSEQAGRLFVVGDRKQAIYEFRGADVAVFQSRTEAMKAAGAGEVLLRRSFRSTPSVVEACNQLFVRAFHHGEGAWALRFDPDRDGLVAHRKGGPNPGAEVLRSPATRPEDENADGLRKLEARAVADRMRALVDSGTRPGQIALLMRRYTHLPTYLNALQLAGLPHYVVHGRGFYAAQEVRDLASLIACLYDEEDRFAMVSVLRSPLCGLSDEALAALAAAGELRGSLLRAAPLATLAEDDRAALADLVERLARLRTIRDRLAPAELLRELVDVFDLRAIFAATAEGPQRIANLEHLIARAEALSEDPAGPAADLPTFARWLARAVRPLDGIEAAGAQVVDERDDVVRVMTIHQAKGLQFDTVFVADTGTRERETYVAIGYDPELGLGIKVPGEVPGKLAHTSASRRVEAVRSSRLHAESMRLFYVAATRARDRVVFSGELPQKTFSKGTTWRAELERVITDPNTAALVSVVERTRRLTQLSLGLVPPPAETPAKDAIEASPALVRLAPTTARSARIAVTQLQDFSLCARRYHLFHELRLDEHPQERGKPAPEVEARADEGDDEVPAQRADPLRAGTLAHRLLERAPFGLSLDESRANLHEQLAEDGYDPAAPDVAQIEERVLRFLGTDFARGLAGRHTRRELSFALSLPGAASVRVLRGQIDLVTFSTDEGVDVVDYKHARRGDLEDHRFQLEAYALAVSTLYPTAPRVRVGLSFLRENDPQPVWVPLAPIEEIASRLGGMLDRFVIAQLRGEREGIARPGCERMRCGYLSWCHGEAAP